MAIRRRRAARGFKSSCIPSTYQKLSQDLNARSRQWPKGIIGYFFLLRPTCAAFQHSGNECQGPDTKRYISDPITRQRPTNSVPPKLLPSFLRKGGNFFPAVALRCDLLFQMVENPLKAHLHGLDSAAMTSNMHSHGRVKRFSIFIIALQPTEADATHLLVTLH